MEAVQFESEALMEVLNSMFSNLQLFFPVKLCFFTKPSAALTWGRSARARLQI